MKQYILLLLFSFSFAFHSYSQDTLGMGSNGAITNISSTNQMFGVDSVSVSIKNVGNTAISGIITTHMAIDSGSGLIPVSTNTTLVAAMMPGDSIIENIVITYDPSQCIIGTNIVVIWPSMAGAVTLDSAIASVVITNPSSVIQIDKSKQLVVYPNPTAEFIQIKTEKNTAETYIKRSRLYDITGAMIGEFDNNTTLINMSNHPSGSYMLIVDFTDNTSVSYKIILQ